MRPAGADDAVVAVYLSDTTEHMSIASEGGRALCFPAVQAKFIRGAGKGVIAMKLRDGDSVLAFELTRHKFEGAQVRTAQGREETVRPSKFGGSRAGRGAVVLKRGRFVEWTEPILRYDLLHAIIEDEKSVEGEDEPPDDGGDPSGGDGAEAQQDPGQIGLPLPFGEGGDA
jgi:DNA gyrase/topoisomerase IV subunit A